jgi:hypothetical protein
VVEVGGVLQAGGGTLTLRPRARHRAATHSSGAIHTLTFLLLFAKIFAFFGAHPRCKSVERLEIPTTFNSGKSNLSAAHSIEGKLRIRNLGEFKIQFKNILGVDWGGGGRGLAWFLFDDKTRDRKSCDTFLST